MVRWICSVKISDRYSLNELREKLKFRSVQEHIKSGRLRWFGHSARMNDERWPKIMLNCNVAGAYPRGRPKKRWLYNINDIKSLNVNNVRCFKERVGGLQLGTPNGGSMVKPGSKRTYQCTRIQSSKVCHNDIHKNVSRCKSSSLANCSSHKKDGGAPTTNFFQDWPRKFGIT